MTMLVPPEYRSSSFKSTHNCSSTALLYRHWRSLEFSDHLSGNIAIFHVQLQRVLPQEIQKCWNLSFRTHSCTRIECTLKMTWFCKDFECPWIHAHTAVYSELLLLCASCQMAVLSVLLSCKCWDSFLLTCALSALFCVKNETKTHRPFRETFKAFL